jgi:Haloacid dehalogenase-like hydrolase
VACLCGFTTSSFSGRASSALAYGWPRPSGPAPDGLHLALGALGMPPDRAVFVGDSPGDMTAARAAGVTGLGATWGWHQPDALLRAGAHQILTAPAAVGAGLLRHIPRAAAPPTPLQGKGAPVPGAPTVRSATTDMRTQAMRVTRRAPGAELEI